MMKTYAKPMVLSNDELSEGIYAASGGVGSDSVAITGCWTGSVTRRQDNQTGRADYRFQINAHHGPDHQDGGSRDRQRNVKMTITFDKEVMNPQIGHGTISVSGKVVTITFMLPGRSGENYQPGDLVVTADDIPGLISCVCKCTD